MQGLGSLHLFLFLTAEDKEYFAEFFLYVLYVTLR